MSQPFNESRRIFLRRLAGGRISGLEDERPSSPETETRECAPNRPSAPQGAYKLTFGRRAMATEFQIIFNLGQYEHAAEVALAALDLLEPLEDMMSFFRPSGELGRINATAYREAVAVAPPLWDLLQLSRKLYDQTGGAFDITAAPLWQVWGFARREGRLPTEDEIRTARSLCGWQWVELDESKRTIRFLRPGVALNLGSIGKGYALDQLKGLLHEKGIHDFVLHGGLSSVWASGNSWEMRGIAEEELRTGWPIGLADPLRPGRRLGQMWLNNQGLGTSGTALQFFWHRGRRYGHIIDPRTGYPAEGVLSATVMAPTATVADALATAFFVLGVEEAARLCEKASGLGAVFVVPASGGPPEIRTLGQLPPLDVLAE